MNKQDAKELLQNNLDYLQELSVPEYTLYRKWIHLNTDKMKKWYLNNIKQVNQVKSNIWIPENINDYKDLNIDVIPADNPKNLLTWRILRELTHSAVWKSSPGRMARYIIVHKEKSKNAFGFEEIKNKYLGIISLGSDFIGIGGRDKYIGWTNDNKMKDGMLKHTCMGSSISPTQPLGYNYLGGKLIALMVCSDKVENHWNNKYKEKLAGITTTSLYGGYSQYTRLKYWRKCKSSDGTITLEPTEETYDILKDWYKNNYSDYNKILKGSHPKARLLNKLYKELGVKTYKNNAPRGVYWCSLYDNSLEFLRCEDKILKNKKFDNSVKTLSELWKEKYASKRIENLDKNNKVSNDILFYEDLINNSWEEVKEKYINEVGR